MSHDGCPLHYEDRARRGSFEHASPPARYGRTSEIQTVRQEKFLHTSVWYEHCMGVPAVGWRSVVMSLERWAGLTVPE